MRVKEVYRDTNTIYRNYWGWLMLPFAGCALFLTVVFIIAVLFVSLHLSLPPLSYLLFFSIAFPLSVCLHPHRRVCSLVHQVCNAIRMRLVSRKCYLLLLNRSLGDLFMCVVALIAAFYVLLSNDTMSATLAIASAVIRAATLVQSWRSCPKFSLRLLSGRT